MASAAKIGCSTTVNLEPLFPCFLLSCKIKLANIKNTADYQLIKDNVNSLVQSGTKSIIVKTPESFSMTSSVIGFFIKVIFQLDFCKTPWN